MVSWAALLYEPVRKPAYIDKAYSRFTALEGSTQGTFGALGRPAKPMPLFNRL